MARGWPATLSDGLIGVRPLTRRDASTWARLRAENLEWLSPWEATLPRGEGTVPDSYGATIAALRRKAREGLAMPFAVTWAGDMVGQVTVSGITRGSALWASIGYWVARSHAGKGVTPTAVALVCDHLFTKAGLHRIEISIRPENAASLRVVEKLGFTEFGLAPRYLHIAGDWRDHRVFQLLKEDVPHGVLDRLRQERPPA
ncbi:GNAT family N-acetyltransferase [Aeromicrobium choanae]|uniref:Ribosomal-protein-alanine N-acetyltransferase n=1 Tax=Aeromicrobium choanae TaxID=1736691 RepID=A0A1T4YTR1_9ACTN|nr:GNAT family protein [Aeromicrobium choanae]SKB05106.1 ribosomal-protein-alanine N-acetyltransferase [Aeromicrobium choanae]